MKLYYKMRKILLPNATAILLQNAIEVHYKMCQVFYYKMCFITKCYGYYNLRRFYYKMGQLLQNATIIHTTIQ